MEKPTYYTVEKMLEMIEEPNRFAGLKLYAHLRKNFEELRGSTHNHQAWPGGYFDHIQDAMNVAIVLYDLLNNIRPLPFSISDVLLSVFLHDMDKPWAYERLEDGTLQRKKNMGNSTGKHKTRMEKINEFGFRLSDDHENGIKYAEGELDDYTNKRRVMGPLAAFVHMCDISSARIWFDHPAESGDPWPGSGRGLL